MANGPESDAGPILNVPNTLSAIRLLGCFVLVALALQRQTLPFLYVFILLEVTDWVDGKLAVWLHQRTVFGARLDSAADAALYGVMLFGILRLKWDFVVDHGIWLVPPLAAYLASSATGLLKFGRIPSYHTYAAKTSAHLVTLAVVFIFAGWSPLAFYVAVAAVTLTNLEAMLMSLVLAEAQVDLRSIYHAFQHRRDSSGG